MSDFLDDLVGELPYSTIPERGHAEDVVAFFREQGWAPKAEAMEELTRRWQMKGWANVILGRPISRMGPIGLGQAVTDWLRHEAQRLADQ